MDAISLYSQIEDLEKAALKEALENHYPTFVTAAQGKSLLTILEENILKWPPSDYRLNALFRAKHKRLRYGSENPFLIKIYQGMELRVSKRYPLESKIEVSILMPSNLAGVESYNQEAELHNDNWIKHGALESIFDPVHLNSVPVNGMVESLSYSSKHSKSLDLSEICQGQLRRAIPAMTRDVAAIITAQIKIIDEEFEVSYCVKNTIGELLYYNTVHERDLSLVGRKIAQECFGNPFQTSQSYIENLLEGIPQLFQGKKTKIAELDNSRPGWVSGSFKSINNQVVDTILSHTYENTGSVFTYLGAIASVLFAIPLLWKGFLHGVSMEPSWDLELGLLVAIGGTFLSWSLGKMFYRKSEIKNRTKYLRF